MARKSNSTKFCNSIPIFGPKNPSPSFPAIVVDEFFVYGRQNNKIKKEAIQPRNLRQKAPREQQRGSKECSEHVVLK
jgi:hypothetical protein